MTLAFFSRSSKPWNSWLTIMPTGGTRPMRDPGGNTGSAASAAKPNSSKKTRIVQRMNMGAVDREPRFPAEYQGIAGLQPDRPGGVVAPESTDPEQARVSQGEREHRRRKIFLVAILVQAHLCCRPIEIDQAGLRRMRIIGEILPGLEQDPGNPRPRSSRLRMGGLVAIAGLVRH